jgi:hypothetical protein
MRPDSLVSAPSPAPFSLRSSALLGVSPLTSVWLAPLPLGVFALTALIRFYPGLPTKKLWTLKAVPSNRRPLFATCAKPRPSSPSPPLSRFQFLGGPDSRLQTLDFDFPIPAFRSPLLGLSFQLSLAREVCIGYFTGQPSAFPAFPLFSLSSVLRHPSSVIRPPSSVIRPPSSVVCPLSSGCFSFPPPGQFAFRTVTVAILRTFCP